MRGAKGKTKRRRKECGVMNENAEGHLSFGSHFAFIPFWFVGCIVWSGFLSFGYIIDFYVSAARTRGCVVLLVLVNICPYSN